MSAFLSPAELETLTGKRQGAAQAKFLRRKGLSPIVRDDGHPQITWDAINAVMTGKTAARPALNLRPIRKAA